MSFFNYKGANVYYEELGSGEPLLFVHDWNSSSKSFLKLNARFLTKSFRVIALDLPGYGKSDALEGLKFGDLSLIIESLLGHMGIKQSHLIGFCMGSAVILDFYLKFPRLTGNLFLIEPLLRFPKVLRPLLLPYFGTWFLKNLGIMHRLLRVLGAGLFLQNTAANSRIFKSLDRNEAKISKSYLQLLYEEHLVGSFHKLSSANLENTSCITGSKSHLLFRNNLCWIKENLKLKRFIELEDAGHFLLIEQPGKVAEIIN